MHSTERLGRLIGLALVIALALVTAPAIPSGADHAPPPGEVAGSGVLEGTETVQDEYFTGALCFAVTRSVFGLRGTGTYSGRTAEGQEVVYRAEIDPGQTLYENGPLQMEVENTQSYYHGPNGTHGTTDTSCGAATSGSPVPAEFRIFAPGNVYRLDGGSQVPCRGRGTFARTTQANDPNWRAEWTLAEDCVVVGNDAGTPGAGVARAGTANTHHGNHAGCFSPPCVDNFKVDYKQYPPIDGFNVALSGPASATVGEAVTLTATVTDDGISVANAPVTFSATGPAPAAPPGSAAVTGADGRASFTFTAAVAGDYTLSASATSAGETDSAAATVTFTPASGAAMALDGPTRAQTEENVPVVATFTDAGHPVPAGSVNFAVAGPGQATPASGTAVTDANGRAAFSFVADRAGYYTVTASAAHLGDEASASHAVHLDIKSLHRVDALSLPAGETRPTAAVIDPAGDYAYFSAGSNLVKVDLDTFQRVGSAPIDTGGSADSALIDPAGDYAYFSINGIPESFVVKVDLNTLQRVGGRLTLEPANVGLRAAVIDPAGNFAYFGVADEVTAGALGRVVKVDLNTFQRVGDLTLQAGEEEVDSAVMDPAGRYAYFGVRGEGSTAGRVVKVDLITFQRVSALTLTGSAENQLHSAVMDPEGNYAYFAADRGSTGRVVKVDLDTFQRVGAVVLADGERNLRTAVIDPAGNFAYFGARDVGVIKVDLATFERVGAVVLSVEETPIYSAVVDPLGDFAYFGVDRFKSPSAVDPPARVVKIAVSRAPIADLVAGDDGPYATDYLTPLEVPARGVLDNDTDRRVNSGAGLTAGQASDPAGGRVVLNPDGSFTYTPDEAFSGTDTFTYTASDGRDYSVPATVSIKVGAAPEGVRGSAYGHFSEVSLFGGPSETRGPGPKVSLAIDASNSPQNARVESAQAQYGPALIFQSGPIDVHAEGATGPTGYATTSADVKGHPDRDKRPGPFLYDGVASICRANRTGTTASATITNGIVETSYYIRDDPNTPEVEEGGDVKTTQAVPPEPPAGYTVEGTLDHIGDRFRIVFNEQTANPDGSRTITGAHMELLGPTAVGEVRIARAECGVNLAPPTVGLPVADFDGNGASDVSVFRPTDGTWYAQGSAALGYGAPGDIAVPADYDGDAKVDVAVFRPSNGVWYIHGSAGADTALAYGASGDIPVPADYDGDGRADIAVFRPAQGAWYIHNSAGGADTAVGYGANGDIPVAADYDGDAKADIAVFRPAQGAWYVRNSAGGADTAVGYGANGDIPVPADYDGNGRADIAVFRPSEGVWYVQGGSATAWGANGDMPVPADYDGDAKADIAVFRPSQGVWYIHNSGGGDTAVGYGANGDVPAPLAPAIRMRFF